jgi:hypothetical protein
MNEKKMTDDNIDIREQLFNDGLAGKVTEIATPVERITRLNGILLDIDPCLFKPSTFVPDPGLKADQFYEQYVETWLDRHPVLKAAEVRNSGSGLHVILRPERPIEIRDDLDRNRWKARVKVLQAALPTDPMQPGMHAMTRMVGSLNGKTMTPVSVIRPAGMLQEESLLALVDEICNEHLTLQMRVLVGDTSASPCPLCRKEKSQLQVTGNRGRCYDCCNKVDSEKLYKALFVESKNSGTSNAAKEVPHA